MNNTDWKILIYLREEKSINKVAKRLFMTQPSLTYRLSQMEKEIGCPLFIRTNKGVHFTDAGTRLYSFAEKELQQYQDMRNYVTHEPNSISGVLRIGASQSFTQSYMPALLKEFFDKYHDIEISLTTATSDKLVKLVKKENIHLAIVRGHQEWPDADILLDNTPLYFISAKPIDLKTIPNEPTIRYQSDSSLDELRMRWWKNHFQEIPHYMLTVSDCLTCLEIINQGLGHSIIPGDLLNKLKPDIYREILYDQNHKILYRPSHMIYKEAMMQSTPLKKFVEFVKDYFKRLEEARQPQDAHSDY